MPEPIQNPASYRDPSGFVFKHKGVLYRQVNQSYKENFDLFIQSGLYEHLVTQKQLIAHTIVPDNITGSQDWYTTLQPEQVPVITYPYEWCFDMLKDAALLTLSLAETAMQYGMMLKDATPYNVQLHQGKVVFIDSLSFEKLDASKPWVAYRQFCESFLAPLALMHFLKMPLQPLLLSYPEGIPLQIAHKMLPVKSQLHLGCYLHLHLHAQYSQKQQKGTAGKSGFSKKAFQNILKSLTGTVARFSLDQKTTWATYYQEASQRAGYLERKKKCILEWLALLPQVKTALDAGANAGIFAELLAQRNIQTVAADADHFAINALYNNIRTSKMANLVPIIADLTQPTPAIGVNNEEHASFTERFTSDLVLALALVHHLAIGRNIPFTLIASFFKKLGKFLIIEYVPKNDEKVMEMLLQKPDIYDGYSQTHFESAFQRYFTILKTEELKPGGRVLYLMQQHEA